MLKAEWDAIAARVTGLHKAAKLHFGSLPPSPDVARRTLVPESKKIAKSMREFGQRDLHRLPAKAKERLFEFVDFLEDGKNFPYEQDQNLVAKARITTLVAFVAEFNYLTSDRSEEIARVSERAFNHLQRTIIVDRRVREQWHEAFQSNEVRCEQLGAVHLLLFGIWAFKVGSAGERTDLVFQEPLSISSEVERAAEGLVLTEWKRVATPRRVDRPAREAHEQAKLYTAGSLASIELARYRYLVLVSQDREKMPDDADEGGVVFRHINIAVNPSSPSKVARSR